MPQPRLQFLLSLIVYTIIVRMLPYVLINPDIKTNLTVLYYPWNFSPMTAMCLFGGAYLADRKMSFLLPLATLFISNLGILALTGNVDWAFPTGRWGFTYFSFTVAATLGLLLRNRKPTRFPSRALVLGLSFELVFFLVSNYLVWTTWATGDQPMYANTTAGLLECYRIGLPFFGKSLLGTATFTMLLFSPLGIRAATEAKPETPTGEMARVRVK